MAERVQQVAERVQQVAGGVQQMAASKAATKKRTWNDTKWTHNKYVKTMDKRNKDKHGKSTEPFSQDTIAKLREQVLQRQTSRVYRDRAAQKVDNPQESEPVRKRARLEESRGIHQSPKSNVTHGNKLEQTEKQTKITSFPLDILLPKRKQHKQASDPKLTTRSERRNEERLTLGDSAYLSTTAETRIF